MTDNSEREAVVAWLRAGGTTVGWNRASFALRLRAALNAFKAPWALPRAGCKDASNAIERGEHMKGQDHE